ncbi:hypothetical protein [Paracoccus sp. PAMC 22219]|uniref:hypothetical protein n=1 Tax=Paracoccus sp. PAMC 22219 TaxID=1569209 RepID=UPI0012E0B70C|nr:hypothetical protein [Paracoccus sp. PAMC 22219]
MTLLERKEAVEYAIQELAEILSSEAIRGALTPEERKCDEHCEALWKLRKDSATARHFATLSGLDLIQSQSIIARPTDKASDFSGDAVVQDPYLTYVLHLLATSSSDVTSFDSLFRHAAELYRHGEWPVPILREFKDDVDFQERSRPYKDGRQKDVVEREYFISIVIYEVHRIFNVPPTRNDASEHRDSACDIVAEAMTVLRTRPNSFPGVKRIWMKRALVV